MSSNESDIIEHLMEVEKFASSVTNSAMDEASRKINEAKAAAEKDFLEKYNGEIASIEQEFSLRRQEILDKTENEIQQYKNTVLSSPQDTCQFNKLLDGILDKWN